MKYMQPFNLKKKLEKLEKKLVALPSFALAFSGGADSSLLLAIANKTHPQQLIAITIVSQFVPQTEIAFTKKIAKAFNVRHICINVDILKNKDITLNTVKRCYFCKKQMFSIIRDTAKKHGITHLVHGVNLDDLNDFRPGLKAAAELGFLAPFTDAGFFKKDIREYSKQIGLETWNKPSQSCFATRIAYNENITLEKLDMIQETETFLEAMGFTHIRVRCHEKTARIEVDPDQITRLLNNNIRQKISKQFAKSGFEKISIDIDGYAQEKL